MLISPYLKFTNKFSLFSQEWEMKASEDKIRYDAEMEEWIADGGVPKVTKRKTKAKTKRKTRYKACSFFILVFSVS